jgi:protein SCO1/2
MIPRRWARALGPGLSLGWVLAFGARAQVIEPLPPELEGVGIDEHLNAALPLDLAFVDESGRSVRLGDFFGGERPVILNLVYYNCPMLCNLLLDGFVEGIRGVDWVPGEKYEIVTVSIDPKDTPEAATAKRDHMVKRLGRPAAKDGWHFLTGNEAEIRALASAVGFNYRYDERKKEYMHAAAIYVATPKGILSRYLYGVQFDPATVRLSLVEASDGKVGSTMDQILLYCFAYDHTAGRYGPVAFRIMQVGAALCALVLGAFLSAAWIADARRRRRPVSAEARS